MIIVRLIVTLRFLNRFLCKERTVLRQNYCWFRIVVACNPEAETSTDGEQRAPGDAKKLRSFLASLFAAPEPRRWLLTDTSYAPILVHMKTTLNIDDAILKKASQLTGVREKTALVRMGLEALVANRSAHRLAALGGSEPDARHVPRRRTT